MWELPEVVSPLVGAAEQQGPLARVASGRNDNRRGRPVVGPDPAPALILRHSITVTDYTVRVWRTAASRGTGGEWIAVERLRRVALTGLARKILRKAEIF